jgi:hypothetical protein
VVARNAAADERLWSTCSASCPDSLNWAHRSFKSPPPIGSNVGVRRACLILFSEARPNSLKSRTNHFTLLLKQQREV